MKAAATTCAELATAAARHGLELRGGMHPGHDDDVPALADGRATATLVLLGNVGATLWPVFSTSAEFADGLPDPLDRWSRRVIDALAVRLGGCAVYPFDGPPWLPFQRWAMRADTVFASPIGPLIHVRHGLWHAYRGALLLAEHIDLPPRPPASSPCLTCIGQACLHTCPVGAMQAGRYDVDACVTQLDSPAGVDCLEQGCRARRACPVVGGSRYPDAQQALHMHAFHAARRRARGGR